MDGKSNKKLIREFGDLLQLQGLSQNTIRNYAQRITKFLESAGKPAKEVKKLDINNYFAKSKREELSDSSIGVIKYALNLFYGENFLDKLDLISTLTIKRNKKKEFQSLSKEEIKLIIKSIKPGRDRLMVKFLYATGAKSGELVSLTTENINFDTGEVILSGGGRKLKMNLSTGLLNEIKVYLTKKKIDSPYIFSKKNGKGLTSDTIQRIVKNTAKQAKIGRIITPSHIRATHEDHIKKTGLKSISKSVESSVKPIKISRKEKINYFKILEIHPEIKKASEKLYNNKHYDEAVVAAMKKVNNKVKEKSEKPKTPKGEPLDGTALMNYCFKRRAPLLKINPLENLSQENEQEGFMHIFAGAMQALRNPGSHEDEYIKNNPERAIEYICLASLLAKKIDESEVNK